MKRIFSLLVCLSILCVFAVPAFADDETDSVPDSGDSMTETVSEPSAPVESPSLAPAGDTSAPAFDSGSFDVETIPEVSDGPVEDVTPAVPVAPPVEDVPSADDAQIPADIDDDVFVDASAGIPGFDEGILDPAVLFGDASPSFTPYSVYSLDDGASVSVYSLEDTESLPAVLTALFGEYQPRVQTVTDYLSDGSSVTYQQYVPGLAGLDYAWLASVALFALVLYCILRMVGGALKWS